MGIGVGYGKGAASSEVAMVNPETIVIVGAGIAGVRAAEALRDADFDGRVVLFGDEDVLPYDRIPLSLEFLAPKTSRIAHAYGEADQRLGLADFTLHDLDWYRHNDIELQTGTRVTAIHPAAHTVTAGGDIVGYDKLLLATGSRSRSLPNIDMAGRRVHSLRSYRDAVRLDAALTPGSSVAIIGAGWIGLEVAAAARHRGLDVTVIGRSPLPLARSIGPELGAFFAETHRVNGVQLRMGVTVTEITPTGLLLSDGTAVAADTLLVAVGADPEISLARSAGLSVGGGGVLVDAGMQTSDRDVYAVGDIAAARNPFLGTRIRVEHWATARKQPKVAVAGMLGNPGVYDELPYFFTDQFDLGMEYVGYAPHYRRVVFRGAVADREFVAFWLDERDRVLAGMNVNVPGVIDDIKTLIRRRQPVAVERLTDPRRRLTEAPTR
ncbi:pyridine nucleotide-disulfide oxidoreductase [Mycolicibacillus koreensis]|nr:pyridine nucleotide-disulfide oxidoreductase [Mycolicibacillus koreensis]